MTDPTSALAVPYVRLIAEQLEQLGVSLEHWLGLSGLRVSQLVDDSFVLDLPTFRSLALDALRLSGEPALGLLVGQRLGMRAHGTLGHAAMSSRTLREVLSLIERYIGLRIALLELSVAPRGPLTRVCLAERVPLGDLRPMVLEGVVCSISNVLRDVSTGACEIQAVAFPFADPGHGALARALLQCPVAYDQDWIGLSLSTDVLDLPLKMSDPRAFRGAEELCRRELLALEGRRSWTARVQRVLLETRVGFPSLEETARRLHVTPRTLHRRLDAEGTSFRAVLDDLRQRSAVDQLGRGDATIDEVAYILGYSDPANFRRAFRRWTGTSPGRFRADGG
ncbi:MAG: AraC family transcriptional regulator [Alphaproteobacteria bacterium]|nr:AraC family transcriptional regulator [Alphaproteobacteria bacterium]